MAPTGQSWELNPGSRSLELDSLQESALQPAEGLWKTGYISLEKSPINSIRGSEQQECFQLHHGSTQKQVGDF